MSNDIVTRLRKKGYECSAANAGQLVVVRKPDRKKVGPEFYLSTGESLELLNADPPPWHPKHLEGLQEGWIADDIVGTDASVVQGWPGLVRYPLTQSSNGKRPLLYTSDTAHLINGHQVVGFDGSNDALGIELAQPFNMQMHSIIAVCRPNPPGSAEGALWGSGDESANNFIWGGYDGTAVTAKQVFHQRATDTEDILTGPNVANAVQTVEWSTGGATHALRVNHAMQTLTVTAGANNGDSFADTPARDNFTIGERKLGSENLYWKGDLACLFVLSHITHAERGLLFAWIAANYATGL